MVLTTGATLPVAAIVASALLAEGIDAIAGFDRALAGKNAKTIDIVIGRKP
jgi:hypothetical protein